MDTIQSYWKSRKLSNNLYLPVRNLAFWPRTVLVSSFILTWMSMCPTIALSCQTWMSELDASSLNVQFKTIEIYQNKSTFCFLFLIFQDLLSQIYNTFLWLSVSGQIKYLFEPSSICNLQLWMYNFIILGKLQWTIIIL